MKNHRLVFTNITADGIFSYKHKEKKAKETSKNIRF